jgi:hypothetical protein
VWWFRGQGKEKEERGAAAEFIRRDEGKCSRDERGDVE